MMTDYKAVVRHVRYWRGTIQKWSTVYPFTGSGAALNTAAAVIIQNADDALCYAESGVHSGGAYQTEFYHVSGGAPIVTLNSFDPETPGAWVGYGSSGWSLNTTRLVEVTAEVSLGVRWAAGLSTSGKPVYFRKWIHAVPVSASTGLGGQDIVSTEVTNLTARAVALQACLAPTYGLSLGNSRTLAGAATVSAWYENHQMPRGRRRKALVTAGGRYTGPTVTLPGGSPVIPD